VSDLKDEHIFAKTQDPRLKSQDWKSPFLVLRLGSCVFSVDAKKVLAEGG